MHIQITMKSLFMLFDKYKAKISTSDKWNSERLLQSHNLLVNVRNMEINTNQCKVTGSAPRLNSRINSAVFVSKIRITVP